VPALGARSLSDHSVWLMATRSVGKLRELRPIFRSAGVSVIDLVQAGIEESGDEESIEAHETFEENALAKARYFFERSGGRNVIADDSGLEVAALHGAPGVRSKRWSGRADLSARELEAANNALLLERLSGVDDRRARFVCAAAWCGAKGSLAVRGEVGGLIVDAATGANGFGYDPHFFAEELGMTLASASIEEKERVSHRGRAFGGLIAALRSRGVL
jgi:XTP/dITP diphosphohydrolase